MVKKKNIHSTSTPVRQPAPISPRVTAGFDGGKCQKRHFIKKLRERDLSTLLIKVSSLSIFKERIKTKNLEMTMSLARARTPDAQSTGKRTKHEATVPPQAYMYFTFHHNFHPDSNVNLQVTWSLPD